jgi:hypothetical protein
MLPVTIMYNIKKVKFIPVHDMREYKEGGVTAPPIFHLSTRWR